MEWVPPEMREDTGEIELALQNKLPKIVELADIKGDFHLHSNFPIEESHDAGTKFDGRNDKKSDAIKIYLSWFFRT